MAVLKIKSTPKGEGGSKVIANPTLEGDEQNLEGLEVEGTKYKVSGGSGDKEDTELILGSELLALKGKHLSIDKLIALIQKYNLENTNQRLKVGISANGGSSSTKCIISLYKSSGLWFHSLDCVLQFTIGASDNLTQIFTTFKSNIENHIINSIDETESLNLFLPFVNKDLDYDNLVLASKQEILDLFVD